MQRVSARGGWFSLGFLGVCAALGGGGVLGVSDTAVTAVVVGGGLIAAGLIWARGLWRVGDGHQQKDGLTAGLVVLSGLLVWLGQQLGGGSAGQLLTLDAGTLRGLGLIGIGGGVGAVLGFAAAWIATRGAIGGVIRGPREQDLGAGLGWGALSVFVVLAVGVAAQFVAGLVRGETPDAIAHDALAMLVEREGALGGWWWLAIGYVVVIAPVVEEVIYRGFVQEAFGRWFGGGVERDERGGVSYLYDKRGRWMAILATGGVFAVIHITIVDGQALVPLFALSCLLGVLKERTGGVWAGVIVHGLFNAANVGIALAG